LKSQNQPDSKLGKIHKQIQIQNTEGYKCHVCEITLGFRTTQQDQKFALKGKKAKLVLILQVKVSCSNGFFFS